MKEILETIIKNLVDNPEAVEIKEVEVCRLSEKQRGILQDAKKELSLISESLKKLAS